MNRALHRRIRTDIESEIMAGGLRPGDRLPTEAELTREYGCSRMTVSKALSALVASGLIDRRKRAGSFVARPRVHATVLDIPDLQNEVVRRGQDYRFDVVSREVRGADRDSIDEVKLAGEGLLLFLDGVHVADGCPLAFERRWISLAAVPEAQTQPFDGISPGSWLLGHVPWTEAETRIAAVAADAEVSSRLQLSAGTACLMIERGTWRGAVGITRVQQYFVGTSYDLVARFGPREGRMAPTAEESGPELNTDLTRG